MNDINANLPLGKIMKNCLYVLRYSFGFAPGYFTFYIFFRALLQIVGSIIAVLMMKYLIDSVTNNKSFEEAVSIIVIIAIILSLTIILTIVLDKINEVKSIRINGEIQRQIMLKASKIDMIRFDDSEFYNEFKRALDRGDNTILRSITLIVDMIAGISSIVSVSGIIMFINPVVGYFPLIAFLTSFVTSYWIRKVIYRMSLESDPVVRRKYYSSRVFYQADYAKEMKLTKIKEPLFKQFYDSVDEERAIAKKHGLKIFFVKLSNYIVGWTFCVYYIPPLYMVYSTMVTKQMKSGDLAAMHSANTNVFYTLNGISDQILELQSIGMFAENFRKFMEYKTDIEDSIGDPIPIEKPQLLEIKNMTFCYEKNGKKILNNINITIKPYEKIAIVGHNGAGKSTFVKLLLRLYETTEGGVYYGGKNIKEYNVRDYRNSIGSVSQDFQLYAGTIGQNIMMDYTSEEDAPLIRKALEDAGLYDKVSHLKDGIETQLTREFYDQGTLLSGGEKQRIAITRLLVKNFPITILDEPSSALDPIAESELNNLMLSKANESTVIFISHRLSTTKMADRIYLFENGKVAEEGTHDELMRLNGKYSKMFAKQALYYV